MQQNESQVPVKMSPWNLDSLPVTPKKKKEKKDPHFAKYHRLLLQTLFFLTKSVVRTFNASSGSARLNFDQNAFFVGLREEAMRMSLPAPAICIF